MRPPRALLLAWTLAVATLLATTLTGGLYFSGAAEPALASVAERGLVAVPAAILKLAWAGLPFALSLMAFFLAHELGHFFACRHYGVACTPPYFIPAPLLLFGTLGAVIRIRSPIPSRRVLFDVGMAGPLAGFPVAALLTLFGLVQGGVPPASGDPAFGHSLLTLLLSRVAGDASGPVFLVENQLIVAGWVGILATAMNLIPAGQLDGGHIAYAIAPRGHRLVSLLAGMFLAGIAVGRPLLYGEYSAWTVWALIVLLVGRRHPPVLDPRESIGTGRGILTVIGLIVLSLCLMPHPLSIAP
jgi:membrane-associated protease RseP (regulator of RpoE activity)